jgi:hypothetical protein
MHKYIHTGCVKILRALDIEIASEGALPCTYTSIHTCTHNYMHTCVVNTCIHTFIHTHTYMQLVNHFEGNSEITSKGGLCRTMRNAKWVVDEDTDRLVPRCFDVSDSAEVWKMHVCVCMYAYENT